jgi:hypothetical protein
VIGFRVITSWTFMVSFLASAGLGKAFR